MVFLPNQKNPFRGREIPLREEGEEAPRLFVSEDWGEDRRRMLGVRQWVRIEVPVTHSGDLRRHLVTLRRLVDQLQEVVDAGIPELSVYTSMTYAIKLANAEMKRAAGIKDSPYRPKKKR